MQGDIAVESELGKGSFFAVRLPRVVGASPAPSGPSPEPVFVTPTVLVVDDDRRTRDLLAQTLRTEGFKVILAGSGEEAMRLARAQRPDAITLDVLVAGGDGGTMLRSLHSDPVTASIPVISVSVVDGEVGLVVGVADSLTKPLDRRRLASVLRRFRGVEPGPRAMLVLKDDPTSLEVIRQTLDQEGWRGWDAGSPATTRGPLPQDRPDLVVLDLMTAEVGEIGLISDLRQAGSGRSIPVVLLVAETATAADSERLRGQVRRILREASFSRVELVSELRHALAVGRRPEPGGATRR
jgi:DNA-binding response OmpR family regulator